VEPGGFAVRAGFVDALASVGDDRATSAPAPATTPKKSFTSSKSLVAASFLVLSISWKSSRYSRP
jgi:hypothetical protein